MISDAGYVYELGLLGSAVFAISGALTAGRRHLDWIGVLVLASVTAIGGGTIRDVILGREVFWLHDENYFWTIALAALMTMVTVRFWRVPRKTLLLADALGLALFAISGAEIALAAGMGHPVVVVLGVITGTAGGVIRDVLVGEIPLIFRATEPLYSVAAVSGIVAYLLAVAFDFDSFYAALLGIGLILLIRVAAIYWQIRLPAFRA